MLCMMEVEEECLSNCLLWANYDLKVYARVSNNQD